jgi:hypothetical protein
MNSSTEATHALNYALKRVEEEFKEVADGQEMIEKITNKFVQTCNEPPVADFEFVLHKRFTNDEVCIALFQPRIEQIPYFSDLLIASNNIPKGHQLTKLCPLIVSLLFLVHRY